MSQRLRTLRHKLTGGFYRACRAVGRPFSPCPDCREQIPRKAKRCRFCGWQGGYRAIVRPTLRHFLLRLVNLNLRRSGETMPCPHCQWAMPAKARRCPLCLRPPEATVPDPIWPMRLWLKLRRRWVNWLARDAMICPICSVQVPPWAPGCLCCGWERPRAMGKIATMGYAFAEVRGEMMDRLHPQAVPAAGDICPDCDILVPPSDRRCLICGWTPDRKTTMRDAANYLLAEIKQRGTVDEDYELNTCKVCQVPMPRSARICLVCGWAPPVKNPVMRYLRKKKVRKYRKYGPTWRPCPNCRVPLTRHAVKCVTCGWEKRPVRYWGRGPRALWLTMTLVVLVSYFAFQYFVVLASGGRAFGSNQDRYGRTRTNMGR